MTKTALVTGASSGIGLAVATLFAGRGWNVVATMRDPDKAPAELAAPEIFVTRLDVQNRVSIEDAIAAGIARFGRIDGLVNNAGFGQFGLFEATPRDKVIEQFEVNVFGVMDVTRAILPHFRANKAGTIVNMSSGAGMFTLPMISLYAASKFALEGFSEAISYELASQNITVKIVQPFSGVTQTRFSERTTERLADSVPLSDYDAFAARTRRALAAMRAARAQSSDDVAKIVYAAMTDGSDQLRYPVGDDAQGFLKARRELSDQEYVDFMRATVRGEP